MFSKKVTPALTDEKLQEMAVEYTKKLDRKNFKKFFDGMDLINQGWNKIYSTETISEKDDKDMWDGFEDSKDDKDK